MTDENKANDLERAQQDYDLAVPELNDVAWSLEQAKREAACARAIIEAYESGRKREKPQGD